MNIKLSILALLIFGIFFTGCKTDTTTDAETTKKSSVAKINTDKIKNKLKQQKIDATKKVKAATQTGEIGPAMAWNKIDDLESLVAKDKKKVLIDVYTSWCGWCKVMDKQTFTNPEVQAYLDENYHVVKFNAEQKEPIMYKGKKYESVPGGRRATNALAIELLKGRLGYPSLVMLDENLNTLKVSPGFKKPDQLLTELKAL